MENAELKEIRDIYRMPLLTVDDCAELMQINRARVYALIHAGSLRALRLGKLRVRREELDRFLKDAEGQDLSDPSRPVPLAL